MESDFETVLVEFDEETGVGRLTMNRPDSLNALSSQLRADLAAAVEAFEAYDDEQDGVTIRVIIVKGAGDRAFCAGADVNEFTDDVATYFSLCPAREAFEDTPIPIIAEIDGYCLGGGFELAFAADLQIASENSEFGFPEVNHGIVPAGGGIQYLVRLLGPARTKELLLTGEHFSPERAAELSLVNEVHPADELEERVSELAETIASKPPMAVRAIKDGVRHVYKSGIRDGRKYDRGLSFMLKTTDDHKKAIDAFGEDRMPTFEGR